MHIAGSLFAFVLQDTIVSASFSHGQTTALMIFAGIVTIAFVAQAVVLIGFAYGATKARREFLEIATDLRVKAVPVIDTVQELVQNLAPKLDRASTNLTELTELARKQLLHVDSVTSEAAARTQHRMRQVDGVVDRAVSSVDTVRHQIFSAVMGPVKEIVGVLAGTKAAVQKMAQTFRASEPGNVESAGEVISHPYTRREREEMFGDGEEYHS